MKSSKRQPALTGVRNERAPRGLTCVRCRYALVGLALDGVCPECGYEVERSLPGGVLKGMSVYELWEVRPVIGLWAAVLIVMALVFSATGLACPGLVRFGDGWQAGQSVVRGVLWCVAAFAWFPLLPLRKRSLNPWVRGSAWLTPVCLWLCAAFAGFGVYAAARGVSTWSSGWTYTGLASACCAGLAQAGFFVAGTRFSRALTHDVVTDGVRLRWVMVMGVVGSVLPLMALADSVHEVRLFLLRNGLPEGGLYAADYAAATGGALAVAAACMLWAGVCGRTDRRTREYMDAQDAERLKKQLEGVG